MTVNITRINVSFFFIGGRPLAALEVTECLLLSAPMEKLHCIIPSFRTIVLGLRMRLVRNLAATKARTGVSIGWKHLAAFEVTKKLSLSFSMVRTQKLQEGCFGRSGLISALYFDGLSMTLPGRMTIN